MRPKVGNDEVSIFIVSQDELKIRFCLSTAGSPEDILRVGPSSSITPVFPYTHCRSLTIYLEAMITLVWRCTCSARSSDQRDVLGGRDRLSLKMHLVANVD
jgi:hypothetical protein